MRQKNIFNNVGIGTISINLNIYIFTKVVHYLLHLWSSGILYNFILPPYIVDCPHVEIVSLSQNMQNTLSRTRVFDIFTTKFSSSSDNLPTKKCPFRCSATKWLWTPQSTESTHPSSRITACLSVGTDKSIFWYRSFSILVDRISLCHEFLAKSEFCIFHCAHD